MWGLPSQLPAVWLCGGLVRLAVRRVVVLGRGLDAGERLPALGAAYGLVVRLRGGGRVVARLVANRVVASRRLIRCVRPVARGCLRRLALAPAPLGLGLWRRRDRGLGGRSGLGARH